MGESAHIRSSSEDKDGVEGSAVAGRAEERKGERAQQLCF